MKKAKQRYIPVLLLLAIPLVVFPMLTFFASAAWAEDGSATTLVVSPTSLAFTYQQGGTLPPSQTLSVTRSRTVSFTDSASTTSGGAWLSVGSTSGSTPGSIRVSVHPGTLAAGSYTGSVLVSSRAGSVTVPVTLRITAAPTIAVSPASLRFSYQVGGTAPSSQSLSVTRSGGTITFTDSTSGASWLSVSRTSGSTPSSIVVSVNPSSLATGTYNASVRVSSSANSVTIPITLTITSATSGIAVSPTALAFSVQQGGTAPPSQSLSMSGNGTVSFTDSASGGSWLSVGSTSGTTPGSIRVLVTPGTLSAGTYTGSVLVSSSTNSATVPVTLTITSGSGGGGGSGGYALLAWSELGMHCMDGKDFSVLSLLPPFNTIYAKLLTTGTTPTEVTSGVTLTYTAFKDASGSINTTSVGSALSPYSVTPNTAQKTNFWNYVRALVGLSPTVDEGLLNTPVQNLTAQPMKYGGGMILDPTVNVWKAEGIPTSPYDDKGAAKPYPMVQITARNSSGAVIATATVVLAVSDEISCKNCHAPSTNPAAMPSGGWINNPSYTADQNTRLNILKKHDDLSPIPAAVLAAVQKNGYTTYQSSLYDTAWNGGALGNPVECTSCHANSILAAAGLKSGVPGVRPETTDMHSLHASVTLPGSTTTLDNMTSPSNPGCYQCHPGPTTQCQRGVMTGTIPGSTAATCYTCHGNLSRVGASTRTGWLDVPTCQMCHQNGTTYTNTFTTTDIGPSGTQRTTTDATFASNADTPSTGFSLYRFSTGHGGVNCAGCHGSQHAEYPTNQANDQVYSTNLQGYGGRITECSVCHTSSFATTNNGGPHGMHTVGSAWVSAHPNYASSSTTGPCAYCHGTDFRGTSLSMILTTKTLAGRTFPAYHQMNCYDCHNGPSGD